MLEPNNYEAGAQVYNHGRLNYDPEDIASILGKVGINRLDPTAVIVDVGAGTGKLSQVIRQGFEGTLVCVEPSEHMQAELQKNAELKRDPWTEYQQRKADEIHWPKSRKKADLIIMGDAAHWLEPGILVADKFKEMLKPEGKVAAIVRYPNDKSPMIMQLHELLKTHCKNYSSGGANQLVDEALAIKKQGVHLIKEEGGGYRVKRYFRTME